MTLIEIKHYMMTVKFASLTNLCRIFQADAETVRCLLRHWINKGKVRLCDKIGCKTPCASKCAAVVEEHYEWLNC